jgi:MFS family permease
MFEANKTLRYIVAGSVATACGSLACGWFVQYLVSRSGWDIIRTYRAVFWVYACCGLMKLLLALCLSNKCEVPKEANVDESTGITETEPLLEGSGDNAERSRREEQLKKKENRSAFAHMSKHTWRILFALLPLFAVDSFASGLVPL